MNHYKWQRFFLCEINTLPRKAYGTFEEYLDNSGYWELDNDMDSLRNGRTPLSMKLEDSIKEAFAAANIKIMIKVEVLEDVIIEAINDSFIAYAEHWGYFKNKEMIKVFLKCGNAEDMDSFDPELENRELAEVLRHELIHSEQLKKQMLKKRISRKKAEKEREEDPLQSPKDQSEEAYFSSHPEIDAYAHQVAEELIRKHSKEWALKYLSMSPDNPKLPWSVKMLAPFQNIKSKKLLDRFRKKVYAYIEALDDSRDIDQMV